MAFELADLNELLGRARGGTIEPPVPVELLLDRDIDPDPRPLGRAAEGVSRERLDRAISGAAAALLAEQRPRGEWCFELESNAQIESQWILTLHYLGLGEREQDRQRKLLRRLKATQQPDGGWKLYDDTGSDLSITVQAYFAAKLAGERPHEPWLERARAFIRQQGGAERASVITRIYLALFDQYPWALIPALPVAVMLMPRGTAFNIYEQAYWARTCVVPLLVLYHQRRIVTPPPHAAIDELYVLPKDQLTRVEETGPMLSWRSLFHQADRVLKAFERAFSPERFRFRYRQKALKLAERWLLDHQDQDGGWGGIFPAMTHSVMALASLGYPIDSGPVARGLQAIRDLEIEEQGALRVQPCVSPVWDTAWAVIALCKAGLDRDHPAIARATDWLYAMQILKPGDWSQKCPDVVPGGWAFQYFNDFYPDTDDSSVVLMALLNSHYRDDPGKRLAFDRGIQWLLGLQNQDGGWGAFERGVDNEIYNEIRFNDAQNMLDPSTVDVTGRCAEVLAKLGYPRSHKALRRAVRYILREQEKDGSFWGRWGVNYVYGTWSALCALSAAKVPHHHPAIERAARWLEAVQRPDGGFGESCTSYASGQATPNRSCPSQTAWGVMGFLAAGKASSEACRRAVEWLLDHIDHDGSFREDNFTGTGFPNVFYLRYHGYPRYFPLLALARYREALA